MKVRLLNEHTDYQLIKLSEYQMDVMKDLGLEILVTKMVAGNKFMYDCIKPILMDMQQDKETILYRQEVLKDVLENEEASKEIFSQINALDSEIKTHYMGILEKSASAVVSSSNYLMELCLNKLMDLYSKIMEVKGQYSSKGMVRFLDEFCNKFNPKYILKVQDTLSYLRFEEGILLQASLSKSLDPCDVSLTKYEKKLSEKMKIKFSKKVEIKAMDEAANKEFIRLTDLAVEEIYQTMYKVCNSMIRFIHSFRMEFGFYVSACNLYHALKVKGLPICYPSISTNKNTLGFKNLCDVSLGLATKQSIIGNDLDSTRNQICMITGANQGGKSTFLRSLGQNYILAQCGLFVGAEQLELCPIDGIYTHFNRQEDSSMQSGKLDEELKRMNTIVNIIKPNSLILFNESFSSTNEREGTKIAYDIINALVESEIKVFFVTHMYELSNTIYNKYKDTAVFLFAARFDDGTRDYHLRKELPQKSSYAMDLYNNLFVNN